MKIAVTYENGQVFMHFGKCQEFKVYDVEDGKVVSAEIIGANGSGHSALAGLMASNNIDVVICGGIGGGAINALEANGIKVCPGQEGNTDALVEAFLRNELSEGGANCGCDHHDESHECDCGEDDGCSCGGDGECSCGDDGECGCSGGCGCHAPQIIIDGPNAGKQVSVHYRGTLNDGTQFDSSYDRGQTLDFTCGIGQMIRGFDQAVANMKVGDVVDVHLMPEEAYGPSNPQNIMTFQISELPGSEDLNVGQRVYLQDMYGRPIPVSVTAKTETTITLDANHEMAGKELNFRIELVSIND